MKQGDFLKFKGTHYICFDDYNGKFLGIDLESNNSYQVVYGDEKPTILLDSIEVKKYCSKLIRGFDFISKVNIGDYVLFKDGNIFEGIVYRVDCEKFDTTGDDWNRYYPSEISKCKCVIPSNILLELLIYIYNNKNLLKS
ncbi:MAG: hypothetical protein E6860_04730 [Clostridium sp.]|uniref:hypothetical protein n=1 Tax=Clostridium sp. TaxID=1506 RepID=UPI0029043541|nr:hypothetical protein [Clostridium sp.]MDU1584836.1 hypothetical protein [Clostridium sp.]